MILPNMFNNLKLLKLTLLSTKRNPYILLANISQGYLARNAIFS